MALFNLVTGYRLIESIRNFVQLTAGIGTAGQPRADQFSIIADAGYEIVVNLAMPDHADSLDNEGKLVRSTGMSYSHLPVPFDSPHADHVLQFCQLMGTMKDRKVFVHCIMNYRVSAFMFHYLEKVQGCSTESARSPIFEQWEIEPAWQMIIDLSAEEIGL